MKKITGGEPIKIDTRGIMNKCNIYNHSFCFGCGYSSDPDLFDGMCKYPNHDELKQIPMTKEEAEKDRKIYTELRKEQRKW